MTRFKLFRYQGNRLVAATSKAAAEAELKEHYGERVIAHPVPDGTMVEMIDPSTDETFKVPASTVAEWYRPATGCRPAIIPEA